MVTTMETILLYTIYGRQGDEKYPQGLVGIHIKPFPPLTRRELQDLITQLSLIWKEMEPPAK